MRTKHREDDYDFHKFFGINKRVDKKSTIEEDSNLITYTKIEEIPESVKLLEIMRRIEEINDKIATYLRER